MFYGANSLQELAKVVKSKGLNNLLMITDPGLVSVGLAKQTRKILTKSKLKIDIFDGVNPNPVEENVTKGVKKYQSGKYDGIIVQGRAAVPWMLLGPFASWRYISPPL